MKYYLLGGLCMGILDGNQKNEPLHYGEVHGIWTYLISINSCLVLYELLKTHAGDDDLKQFIKDKLELVKEEKEELESLLKENNVQLPPTPAEKADANSESIPIGARFTDVEVAGEVTKEIAAGLMACTCMMSMSLNEDVHTLFGEYHTKIAAYGLRLIRLIKEKGWVVTPPLHRHV
jgi:hypothetical protein